MAIVLDGRQADLRALLLALSDEHRKIRVDIEVLKKRRLDVEHQYATLRAELDDWIASYILDGMLFP